VGLDANSLVLGKHSGRAALRQALEDLGYTIDGAQLKQAFERFKEVADRKKQVTAMDLEALVTDELREDAQAYALEWFDVEASNRRPPHATVAVRTPDDTVVEGSFTGDGPVDAIFRAINSATGIDARLREFRVDAVTGGQDALGEVSVVVELGSPEEAVKTATPGVLTGQRVTGAGQAVATDIIEAAAIAYVRALGNAVHKAQTVLSDAELAQTP
jgi:2-isopropylmalate synthase